MEYDAINAMVADAGKFDDQIAQILRTADDTWAIQYQTGQIELDYDPAFGRLVFSAVIGPAKDSRRDDIYEFLLMIPLLWKDTGGLRVGMAGRGGALVALHDLIDPFISAQAIAVTANRLAVQSGALYAFVSSDSAPAASDGVDPLHFIRI